MDKENNITFICDSMFGKLAKWLRMAGYFADYIKSTEREKILKNLLIKQGCILITKDKKILNYNFPVFLLDEIYVKKQFKIIKEKFNLKFDNAFTICMECNFPLEKTIKEENKEKIPEFVYKNFNEFFICKKCGRIYWKGSHYQEMLKKLK